MSAGLPTFLQGGQGLAACTSQHNSCVPTANVTSAKENVTAQSPGMRKYFLFCERNCKVAWQRAWTYMCVRVCTGVYMREGEGERVYYFNLPRHPPASRIGNLLTHSVLAIGGLCPCSLSITSSFLFWDCLYHITLCYKFTHRFSTEVCFPENSSDMTAIPSLHCLALKFYFIFDDLYP